MKQKENRNEVQKVEWTIEDDILYMKQCIEAWGIAMRKWVKQCEDGARHG